MNHPSYDAPEAGAGAAAPGSQPTSPELIAYCDGKLARYKIPGRVVFASYLPRNAMGKVQKAELRARYTVTDPPA